MKSRGTFSAFHWKLAVWHAPNERELQFSRARSLNSIWSEVNSESDNFQTQGCRRAADVRLKSAGLRLWHKIWRAGKFSARGKSGLKLQMRSAISAWSQTDNNLFSLQHQVSFPLFQPHSSSSHLPVRQRFYLNARQPFKSVFYHIPKSNSLLFKAVIIFYKIKQIHLSYKPKIDIIFYTVCGRDRHPKAVNNNFMSWNEEKH